MEMLVVLGVFALLTLLLVGGVYVAQVRAARQRILQDAELAERESRTHVCMACEGSGYRWEALAARGTGRPVACWRCGGTGAPPSEEDRARFMP